MHKQWNSTSTKSQGRPFCSPLTFTDDKKICFLDQDMPNPCYNPRSTRKSKTLTTLISHCLYQSQVSLHYGHALQQQRQQVFSLKKLQQWHGMAVGFQLFIRGTVRSFCLLTWYRLQLQLTTLRTRQQPAQTLCKCNQCTVCTLYCICMRSMPKQKLSNFKSWSSSISRFVHVSTP